MLQHDKADDFVIATGETRSLEEFVNIAFTQVGLNWQSHVETDPDLLRPTDLMLGKANPSKANKILGWKAEYKMPDVVKMMVEEEQKLMAD